MPKVNKPKAKTAKAVKPKAVEVEYLEDVPPEKPSKRVKEILKKSAKEEVETKGILNRANKGENRYPWKEWFTSKGFVLRQGKHFKHERWIMAQQIRNKASKMKVKVSITIPEGGDSVVVAVRVPYRERG